MNITELTQDLAAFADDDQDVIVERNGDALLVRGGQELTFRVVLEGNEAWIETNGNRVAYRRFISHTIARLDVLAERFLTRRNGVDSFIDGPASLTTVSGDPRDGKALTLLQSQCEAGPPFASQVVFLTADAGFGKTALLREFQARQARSFLDNQSTYLLWHVDLQGRQLLRLSEALMGDLGDLRMSGLWMPGIVRLLRQRSLILAIDGFDELAAEQGSTDALGALALLVQELRDSGTIVAASRRTFFDTDDYLVRAGILHRSGAFDCEFDELRLKPWTRSEVTAYMKKATFEETQFDDVDSVYEEILAELSDPSHPMATRPFLISQMISALLRYESTPAEFLRGVGDDPLSGVGTVVNAFVEREVGDKWRQKDTGEPFLNAEQHLRLLGDVAEEMFRSQVDRLDVDVVEAIAGLLLEEWNIPPGRRQQIIEMVQMHVLLVVPPDGNYRARGFDHPEFRDYFIAQAFTSQLGRDLTPAGNTSLGSLLSAAPLTDATARYVAGLVDRNDDSVRRIVDGLCSLVGDEWRPTHLQANVGTMIPYLLDQVPFHREIAVDARVIYASLVFEDSTLENVTIRNGTFANASFCDVSWDGVVFDGCHLGHLTLDRLSDYSQTTVRDSNLESVRIVRDRDEDEREFAPDRMHALLLSLGITIDSTGVRAEAHEVRMEDGSRRRLARRLLRMFRRTTSVSRTMLARRFKGEFQVLTSEVIPLMLRHGLIREKPWRGSGQDQIWALAMSLEAILRADDNVVKGELGAFWAAIDALDRR